MNNSSNAQALLRTLITYALIVPLALIVGYLLTNPMTYATFGFVGILAVALASPLLLRWHYPLLLFSWFSAVTLFFVKASPNLWMAMVGMSLALSILERILNAKKHFIRVPSITVPLTIMVIVVLVTAKLNGGIGLHSLGSDIYGGKKYIYLFVGIASYFAITARAIPPEKAILYVALFFLGGVTSAIGDLYSIMPSWTQPLFYVFRPTGYSEEGFQLGVTRLGGIANAASMIFLLMLARYGVRGIVLGGKPWRLVVMVVMTCAIFLGGFRTTVFLCGLAFIFMFFAEGLHRTRLTIIFVLAGTFGCAALVPMARHLPFTFQRALAFLPLDLNPTARLAASSSTDWRIQMWEALLPQIPHHLLLGKGYTISPEDYNTVMGAGSVFRAINPGQQALALSSDYHNGMISVVMAFGIWGVIVFLWFVAAGLRVMYLNLRYGRPEIYTANALLFILFFNEAASYLSCFGGLELATDMFFFTGYLGLSIALNNGVCRPPPKTVPADEPVRSLPAPFPRRLEPSFQK